MLGQPQGTHCKSGCVRFDTLIFETRKLLLLLFLACPTSLPPCFTIFIGSPHCSNSTQGSHIDLPLELPSIYVTLSACLPLPSLFAHCAHLTVMISLSCERRLLGLRHKPWQSLALHFETNALLWHAPPY